MAGVKLLSDSNIFKAAIASIQANIPNVVAATLPTSFSTYVESLPNEANGDTIPTTGPYISGNVMKIV